jgi:hypothetical protein
MKIICISGLAQHGKDTAASIMKHRFESEGKRCLVFHYADYLKFIAEKYFGWNGAKDETGRQLLQQLGTNKARKRNPNIWVEVCVEFIKAFGEDYDYILIPDCRFENEIVVLRDHWENVFTIWVHRIGFDNGLTFEQKDHDSETSLLDFPFDRIISVESSMEKLVDAVNNVIDQNSL